MPNARRAQFNVRSAFAKERAHQIARQTGMTASQVVEEALRAYTPPRSAAAPDGLVTEGPLLVAPARGRRITLAEAEDALAATREEPR